MARAEAAFDDEASLPRLIETADLQAELHAHTTASDGVLSIDELVEAALARGFHTIAVTDHSRSQVQANGLSAGRLEKHIEDVRAAAKRWTKKINVLAGSEVDILTDGTLDYPDELLAELDLVVASPHAALSQKPADATKRLLKAMENPHVTVMGHPTGRLVLKREGLSPDMNALVRAAADRGVAPGDQRQPLPPRPPRPPRFARPRSRLPHRHQHRRPRRRRLPERRARRGDGAAGGARAEDVVNTFGREELAAWIRSTKR